MIEKCNNVICYNGGYCDHETMSKCNCPTTFTGSECEIPVPKCENVKCHNQGQCREKNYQAYCDCPAGFGGDFCEIGNFVEFKS